MISRVKAFYGKYEHLFLPSLLVLGFFADVFTFRTLSVETQFILLGIYAFLAACMIVYGRVYEVKLAVKKKRFYDALQSIAASVEQFTFGALMSASLVFYWFSGAFSASWPLIAIVAALMLSNEVFRKYYLRPTVQLGVFAFVLLSYASLLFPFVFVSISPKVYVFAGVASTLAVFLLIWLLVKVAGIAKEMWKKMMAVAVGVFAVMNGLYFLDVIPPIPLFIREAGVYHDVKLIDGEYVLEGEKENILQQLWPGQRLSKDSDGRVYVFTAIFAPNGLTATIYHRWQHYNETLQEWVTADRLSFTLRGGRDAGFRGYTFKTSLASGRWRVIVETERRQELGRVHFTYDDNE